MKKNLFATIFLLVIVIFSYSCKNTSRAIESDPAQITEQTPRTELQVGEAGLPQKSNSICIDRCGDGICQEIVCMGAGCPCVESVDRCPKDCKKK